MMATAAKILLFWGWKIKISSKKWTFAFLDLDLFFQKVKTQPKFTLPIFALAKRKFTYRF